MRDGLVVHPTYPGFFIPDKTIVILVETAMADAALARVSVMTLPDVPTLKCPSLIEVELTATEPTV